MSTKPPLTMARVQEAIRRTRERQPEPPSYMLHPVHPQRLKGHATALFVLIMAESGGVVWVTQEES